MAQGSGKLGKPRKSKGSQKRKTVKSKKLSKGQKTIKSKRRSSDEQLTTKAINKKNESIVAAKAVSVGTRFFLSDVKDKGTKEMNNQLRLRNRQQDQATKLSDRLKDQLQKLHDGVK